LVQEKDQENFEQELSVYSGTEEVGFTNFFIKKKSYEKFILKKDLNFYGN
jgi:hypothetical protein